MPEGAFDLVPVRDVDRGRICDFAASVWGEPGREEVLGRWWLRSDFAAAVAAVAGNCEVAGICVGVPSEWDLPRAGPTRAVSICGWYVAPQFSGRGLGKILVQSFADEAPAMNALSISEAAIRNFAKLGWVGPFATHLRLLPFPLIRRAPAPASAGLEIASYTASAAALPQPLADALDSIDSARPPGQLRRSRRAEDWRAHLSARPDRRPRFHVISRGGAPLGYFIIRPTDEEAGPLYRRARLHYVSDLVVNSDEDEFLRFVFASMARAAPAGAGALLLCTSSRLLADRAAASGWMSEQSRILGTRLEEKAPLYMLGGDLAAFAGQDVRLTFADSDVDLNI